MTKRVKVLVASVLAFLIALSVAVPAQAATKPTVTFNGSRYYYVSRGQSRTFKFHLRSNSYTRLGYGVDGGYRSRFDARIYNYSTDQLIAYMKWRPFTGNLIDSVRNTFSKSDYARQTWYKLKYRTQYRTNVYSQTWYGSQCKWLYIYIR